MTVICDNCKQTVPHATEINLWNNYLECDLCNAIKTLGEVAKDIAHAQLKKVIAEIEALHLLSDDNSAETHQEIFGGLMCEWLEAVQKEIK